MLMLARSGTHAVDTPTTPGVDDLLAAFLAGRSPRTLIAYRGDLEDFRAFLTLGTLDAVATFLLASGHGAANATALAYRNDLLARGLAPATVNRRLAALRSLMQLARTLGLVPWTLELPSVRSERLRDTRGPGEQGVRQLVQVLAGRVDAKTVRDRAMLRLLFDLALRRAEVVALDREDLALDAGTLAVTGKGHREAVRLTLPGPTREALSAWVALRGGELGPLFVNFDRAGKGRRLTATSLYRLVRGLGDQVGIHARPHGLRHAAITSALDRTAGDVRAVQRFSRHRDLRMLIAYDDNRRDLGGQVAQLVAAAVTADAPA